MPVRLTATELSKKYESFLALAPASFELTAGEIAILSGPNGSGKTTLLSCLSGLLRPSSGSVTVAGYDLYRDEVEVRRRLVYVPDVPRFYLELTAWEHLRSLPWQIMSGSTSMCALKCYCVSLGCGNPGIFFHTTSHAACA
jgi:ABC-type multidrug transport system ATPase subunit